MFTARHKKTKLLRGCTDCGRNLDGPLKALDDWYLRSGSGSMLMGSARKHIKWAHFFAPAASCISEGHGEGFKSLQELLVQGWLPDSFMYCSPPGALVTFERAKNIAAELPEYERTLLRFRIVTDMRNRDQRRSRALL
jgi:hypothetical protein